MSSFPGRSQFGGGSVAAIPRLAKASIMSVHQPIVHIMVHAHPQNPPKRRAVITSNACSKITPTPMRTKKPPTVRNSVPRPSPHIPRSCITADTPNAPSRAATMSRRAARRGRRTRAGRIGVSRISRIHHRRGHPRAVRGWRLGGGHCQASCRRMRRPTSDAMW